MEIVTKKSSQKVRPDVGRNSKNIQLPGQRDVVPPPIFFTLDNSGGGSNKTYKIGFSDWVPLQLSGTTLNAPDSISYGATVAGLASLVGDGSLVINRLLYKTDGDNTQFQQTFKYHEAYFQKTVSVDLGPSISFAEDPRDQNDKLLPVDFGEQRLVLSKVTLFEVVALAGEKVTVGMGFSGIEGATVGLF